MLRKIAARLRGLAAPAPAAAAAPRAAILDQYVRGAPSDANAVDIFKGEWWSALPGRWAGVPAGNLPLFDDKRMHWAIQNLGGVTGRKVLELGPMEAGHTWMLEQAGAGSVLAIEANSRCFMKSLIVKEVVGLQRSRFLHGDFEEYLRGPADRFDAVIASGVLYHMRDPVELLQNIARVTDRVFIWSHYYAAEPIEAIAHMRHRFGTHVDAERGGFRHTLHRYQYGDFLNTNRFSGGTEDYSNWLGREELLGALRHVGLSDIVIGEEEIEHVNGPCFSLVAKRPGA
jgi:SAM-dependent methyltransferase